MKNLTLAATLVATMASCSKLGDPNDHPTYGKTGLPKNCRAIIQANIDGYRTRQYSADEVMSSIERNCGANDYSWGE
ncbi:hypothetical protein [Xanthomonas fragariae]|uniref:hypothetical protein n=1 Tax=Xanthomonas fragariae TaxID=48664 RepID=UPI0022AB0701|nr:hypothetical protein [Xanthomonas fragariae]WAT15806.1 hypothetical protein OZ429_05390 [Xanthomonas fragariae]